jgi:hypothetical protein
MSDHEALAQFRDQNPLGALLSGKECFLQVARGQHRLRNRMAERARTRRFPAIANSNGLIAI